MSWNYYGDSAGPWAHDDDAIHRLATVVTSIASTVRPLIVATYRERSVSDPLTAAAIATLDDVELACERIRARHGRFVHDAYRTPIERVRDELEECVGGPDALRRLDASPLPDEPFDWQDIPDDVRARVGTVLGLCDAACDAVLDVEHRTATRRLLARVARHGPKSFRSKARDEIAAAALCWVVARTNKTLRPDGAVTTKELLAAFGVSGSVSDRADSMLRAAGLPTDYGDPAVCSATYLVARRRREIIALRDETSWVT